MLSLPTELITKGTLATVEIRVLTFRALALNLSEMIHSDERLTLERSALESLDRDQIISYQLCC